jgi:hypothetical protein
MITSRLALMPALLGLAMLALSIPMFNIFVAEASRYPAIVLRGQVTEAPVIRYTPKIEVRQNRARRYRATVYYHVIEIVGTEQEIRLTREYPVGHRVAVRYLPDDPSHFLEADFLGGHLFVILTFLGMGLGLAGVGAKLLYVAVGRPKLPVGRRLWL